MNSSNMKNKPALHTLKTSSSHATGPGVGPLHYRLIEGYSKSQAGKRGEKTSGGWCSYTRELGQLPQSRREQDRAVLLALWCPLRLIPAADKELVITKGDDVLRKPLLLGTSALAPCNHEEADSRIMLHATHAAHNSHKKIFIRTVDTDFVVLAVALAHTLNEETEVWLSFGTGKTFHFLAAHEIARALGPEKAQALPMFHALTGCNTVSCFAGHGKRTAWQCGELYLS